MRRAITLFCLAAVLSLAGPAFAQEDVSGLLKQMQQKYAHLNGAAMSYTREVITRAMSMMGSQMHGDIASGKIYFQPPRLMRMEQESPTRETVISDGQTLWWYIPRKKCVYKYPSQKFGKELSLLSDLFRGLQKAEDHFQITLLGRTKENGFRLKLIPTPPWEQIDHIILIVSQGLDIQVIEIHNLMGSVTRFNIKNFRAAGPFEKGFFKMQVPNGVKVIQEN